MDTDCSPFFLKVGDQVDIERADEWVIGVVMEFDNEKGVKIERPNSFIYDHRQSEWIFCRIITNNSCQDKTDGMEIQHSRLRKLNTFTPKHYYDEGQCILYPDKRYVAHCAICNIKICTLCAAVNIILPLSELNDMQQPQDIISEDSDDDSSISFDEDGKIERNGRLRYHCKKCEFSRRYNELFTVIKFMYDSIFPDAKVMEISIIYLITDFAKYYDVKCYKQIKKKEWRYDCAEQITLEKNDTDYDSDEDSDISLGETVELEGGKIGTIRFIGPVNFAKG